MNKITVLGGRLYVNRKGEIVNMSNNACRGSVIKNKISKLNYISMKYNKYHFSRHSA